MLFPPEGYKTQAYAIARSAENLGFARAAVKLNYSHARSYIKMIRKIRADENYKGNKNESIAICLEGLRESRMLAHIHLELVNQAKDHLAVFGITGQFNPRFRG